MGLRTYRTSGRILTLLEKRLKIRVRAEGLENIAGDTRPTLFVVNHFTRFETLLVPYVLYHETGRVVRTLADHRFFRGLLGKYLTACGVMSTKDPDRNRTIVSELMTGTTDWVIYPEGGLVKTKKTVENGKLMLDLPHRKGAPHTGSAVLALKSEICKRGYRRACALGDEHRRLQYEERYGLRGEDSLALGDTIIVPTTITYTRLRSDRQALIRFAQLVGRELTPRAKEEMSVEATLLLGGHEIAVHFDRPIAVSSYLHGPVNAARRVYGLLTKRDQEDLLLKGTARRLTDHFMRRIYENVEVNLDHLFCYGLRVLEVDEISAEQFHSALFLAADRLCATPGVRVHNSLREGLTSLITGDPYEPLESIQALTQREGIVLLEDGIYRINREELEREHEFHEHRSEKMSGVIANEFEPVGEGVKAVRQMMSMAPERVNETVGEALLARDRRRFERGYERWFRQEHSLDPSSAEPFLLEGSDPSLGVVLAHGYLARPEEIRPLAQRLNEHGYTVYGVRLEGHGTSPEHLIEVTWKSWLQSLLRGYGVLQHRCDRIAVGGFSLGGVLSLLLATRPRPNLAGVFTINAPMRLRDFRAGLVPMLVQWNKLARATRLTDEPASRLNDQSESPDINYPVDYLHGLRELKRAVSECRSGLRRVSVPALVIQAEDDPVVRPQSAQVIMERLGSARKRLIELPLDRHVIVRGEAAAPIAESIAMFLDELKQGYERGGAVADAS